MKTYHKTQVGFLSEVIEDRLYISQEEARARDEAEAIAQLAALSSEDIALVLRQDHDRDQRLTNAILYAAKVIKARQEEILHEQREAM
jgi:hypothetical protein